MSVAVEMSDDDDEKKQADAALNQIRALVGEHFEVAVLMCSNNSENGTSYHGFEIGNKFAVRGMVNAYTAGELNDAIAGDDDDDDPLCA
jgi:hypothetical protein